MSVYFVSDLHLGSRCYTNPTEAERAVCQWLEQIWPDCQRLYLLGDILDYWFEYRHVVPRGFTRFLGLLGRMADSGVQITWLTGNHDTWVTDYLPNEIGCRVAHGPIVEEIDGKRFLLAHGDGLGPMPMAEKIMRSIFHSKILRRAFAAVHPRWTVGLALQWSASNRRKHSCALPDITPLLKWIDNPDTPVADYYIFGHYHTIEQLTLPSSAQLVVLGDWLNHRSHATYTPSRGLVITQGKTGGEAPESR